MSLRQLAGKWRLLIILALGALPVVSALFGGSGGRSFVDDTLLAMMTFAIMPFITLGAATAAFGNELEDNTLSNLTLNPVPRWKIVAPKVAAAITVSAPVVVVSAALSVSISLSGDEGKALAAVAAGMLLGAATYSAVFTWAGLMNTRALWYGLAYVLFWEGTLANIANGVKYLSIQQYVLSVVHAIDGNLLSDPGRGLIETPAAVIGAAVVFTLFVTLTVYRLRTMDVP